MASISASPITREHISMVHNQNVMNKWNSQKKGFLSDDLEKKKMMRVGLEPTQVSLLGINC